MKSILMSIKPKWVEKIASGEKTVEVRKTVPKCGTPFKVYIYETLDGGHSCKRCKETSETCYSWAKSGVGCYNGSGTVVGEFVCDKLTEYTPLGLRGYELLSSTLKEMCLSKEELDNYGGLKPLYGLHISNLKIYDKPRALSEFETTIVIPKGTQWFGNKYANKHTFNKKLTRPPQSWCYVEEL